MLIGNKQGRKTLLELKGHVDIGRMEVLCSRAEINIRTKGLEELDETVDGDRKAAMLSHDRHFEKVKFSLEGGAVIVSGEYVVREIAGRQRKPDGRYSAENVPVEKTRTRFSFSGTYYPELWSN